jgi:glucose/arabinose dehydrogenase
MTGRRASLLVPLLACVATSPLVAGAQSPAPTDLHVEGNAFRPRRIPFDEALLKQLDVPTGFHVEILARGLGDPRMLAVDDRGTVYVTRPQAGDVLALSEDGNGTLEQRSVVSGLEGVHGIALRGGELYLATPRQVLVTRLDAPGSAPAVVLDGLPDGGQHPHRTLGFGPDGALYVSVGSSCNACQETNPEHATLLRADVGERTRSVYATGLRNTIGFDWHPKSGALWGMDHGSDWRGDDTPPEELNRLEDGKDYGWPFCFGARQIDPQMKDPEGALAERADTKQAYCAKSEPAVLGYAAHHAPIAFVFYDGIGFPETHRDAAFVALHGSWNRKPADGYKVVALHFDGDRPVRFEDFLSGFLSEDRTAQFGRPAGLAVAKDGALLVSDDANGVIYRVSYGSAKIAVP